MLSLVRLSKPLILQMDRVLTSFAPTKLAKHTLTRGYEKTNVERWNKRALVDGALDVSPPPEACKRGWINEQSDVMADGDGPEVGKLFGKAVKNW